MSQALRSILSVVSGLSLALGIAGIMGESPILVLKTLFGSAVGSRYDLGLTLFYATPLIFTGLSVQLAFRCGLFNVGAEGQLTMGAMGAALVGVLFPQCPSVVAIPFAIVTAFIFGAVWGWIPGVLKATRGSHEVINTIMLNFVASALTSYMTLYWIKNPDTQNPESQMIAEAYRLAPIYPAFIFALLSVLVWTLFLRKTVMGYELRATGANETSAKMAGISSRKMTQIAMAISGGIAGLVAVPEVLGNAYRFKMGFSADYGFIGIAVALLARRSAIGLIFAALLFAILHKGSTALDLETEKVTRDFAYLLEAMIILCVGADGVWQLKKKGGRHHA